MPVNAPENDFPKRLLSAIRRAGSMRKFADEQGINIYYVSQYLSRGIEPTDRTEKGQEVRVKLFLRRKKPQPQSPRIPRPLPDWLRRWRRLPREQREAVIRKAVNGE